jgi:hypothetical protein
MTRSTISVAAVAMLLVTGSGGLAADLKVAPSGDRPACTGNACDVVYISQASDGCLWANNTSNFIVKVSTGGVTYTVYSHSPVKMTIAFSNQCYTSIQAYTANYA